MFDMTQISKLKRAGFTEREINEYQWSVSEKGKPYVTSIDTPLWRDVIQDRKDLVAKLSSQGWNRSEILSGIDKFYTMRGNFDPFDWLKAEYRNPKKVGYRRSERKRVKRRIDYRMKKIFAEREPVAKKKAKRRKVQQAAKDRQQKAVYRYLRGASDEL